MPAKQEKEALVKIDEASKAFLVKAKTKSENPDQKEGEEAPKKYYFIMAVKGVKVVKVVVLEVLKSLKKTKVNTMLQKEQINLKKACREGGVSGIKVFYGQILCKQAAITLQLDPADGFSKNPCNEMIMKDFLNTNGNITYTKVSFEIVEDEIAIKALFGNRVKALKPAIDKAIESGDSQLDDLVSKMKALYHGGRFTEANHVLNEIEGRIGEKGPSDRPVRPVIDSEEVRFKSRRSLLLQLRAFVKEEVAGGGETPVADLTVQLQSLSRDKQFAKANDVLDKIEELMRQAKAEMPMEQKEYMTRRDALEPRLLEAQSANREEATGLGNIWGYAAEQALAGNYENALEALDRLESKIEDILSNAPETDTERFGIREGIVEEMQEAMSKAKIDWGSARKRVQQDLEKLEKEILKVYEGHEYYDEIADKVKKLYTVLHSLDERLIDKLDQALKTSGEEREGLHQEATTIVQEYKDFVETDEFFGALDNNPFTPIKVKSDMQQVLAEMSRELAK